MVPISVGVDIAKEKFDVCVCSDGTPLRRQFQNNHKGFTACLKWLKSFNAGTIEYTFEPTGRYGELLAQFMHKSGCVPLQVQPFEFSRYAESLDCRTKSDEKDSYALAQYALERRSKCREWKPKTTAGYELRDLQLLMRSIVKRSITVQNQLKCKLYSDFVRDELNQELGELEQRKKQALERAETIIRSDATLFADFERLDAVPGIGPQTAILLLTLIDFRSFRNARAVAVFLGLTQRKEDSGKKLAKTNHISKKGSRYIRSSLWMPAWSMRNSDAETANFASRLESKKHGWVAHVAVIRRMVTIAWNVVVKEAPYDPHYRHPLSPI